MRKILISVVAAGVLVAGAFVASSLTTSAASAQTADEDTTQTFERPEFERPERGAVMGEVLAGLVEDGTIKQSQADAIIAALDEKRAELEANRPEGRDGRRGPAAHRRHIQALLEDGVISADEIAALPDDHPFKDADGPFAEELADGQITQEEWDAFIAAKRAERQAQQGAQQGAQFGAANNA
jgi:hypothetical protein